MPYITNIQKYSIHDGDGIRTTVFFKGCPLKCQWCHNPETQKFQKQLLVDLEKCTGCGACVASCPSNAIEMVKGRMVTDQEKCMVCGECATFCLSNIREIAGKEYTIRELVKELMKDEMFYEESGGGVTLSGGEVMCMDMDFIESLVKSLHRKGVTVTIDTCGFAPYDNFKRLLPYIDTFLYDIKMVEQEKHKKYTGVENALILSNLEHLSEDGGRIYIRIPVIKGVNADEPSMHAIVDWLKEHKIHVEQINLLPYHNTGSNKYSKLGTMYKGTTFETPAKEEMEDFAEIFRASGYHNTKIGG